MDWLSTIWSKEPTIITDATTAIIALLVAFNVPVTDAQRAAIVGIALIVSHIVAALVVRSQVSSPATVASLLTARYAPTTTAATRQ